MQQLGSLANKQKFYGNYLSAAGHGVTIQPITAQLTPLLGKTGVTQMKPRCRR